MKSKILLYSVIAISMPCYTALAGGILPGHIEGGGIPCSISYDCGGGTGTPPSSSTTWSDSGPITLAANTCSNSGSVFGGWWHYTTSNVYQPGDSFYPDQCENAAQFVAVWLSADRSTGPTSKSYVDAQMNTVQDAFSGLGSNKLMTYPTTAGGTPGSRDIVTTLGTPDANGVYSNTTDTSVATRGAINTGINAKQNTLHGTSGYAVLNTGTAGSLSEKAIYGSQTQYTDALVETGTLNSAVINAVNSELVQVDAVTGQPSNSGTIWRIADTVTLLPTGNSQ